MKALTEFSGTVIRMAATAESEAKSALPKEPEAAAPAEAAPAAPTEAAADGAAPAEAPAPAPVAAAESESTKAALDEAVSKGTGISGDRLARLREALSVVGNKTADVRLVRVFVAGEAAVPGAKKVGEHQYLVELMPKSMKPSFAPPEKERGRGGHGGGRGAGGGGAAAGGPPTGSFSMDSLKEDRGGKGRGPGRGGPKP